MKITPEQYQWEIDRRVLTHNPGAYLVEYEDGFTVSTEVIDLDTYRRLVELYPAARIQDVYFDLYGGQPDFHAPEELWNGENFARFTEQDFHDGPGSWAFIADDHNIAAWRRL